jgi:hypothetical protein
MNISGLGIMPSETTITVPLCRDCRFYRPAMVDIGDSDFAVDSRCAARCLECGTLPSSDIA